MELDVNKWKNVIIGMSETQHSLFNLVLILAAVVGFCGGMWLLSLLAKKTIFNDPRLQSFSISNAYAGLLFCGALMALSTTMTMTTNSLLNAGAGSIFPPQIITNGDFKGVDYYLIFIKNLGRFIGIVFGFWGVTQLYLSQLPGRDHTNFWPGVIRIGVGSILVSIESFILFAASVFGLTIS